MDALKFLKFWGHDPIIATSTAEPHLAVEPDNGSEEDDSFFDLELTVHDFDSKGNNVSEFNDNAEDKIVRETKGIESRQEGLVKDDDVSEKPISLSANEPISKRKILPIEPVSKPQSPIALLKSAPSFRIFMFKKAKEELSARKTEEMMQQKKETKVFALKLDMEDSLFSPMLSRNGSTSRSHGSKSERFSREVLQKYLKLIKPLYVKISRRNGEKVKFSGDISCASTTSSPSVASVSSSKREKQGNIPAGIRGVCKHLGKSKSASAAAGIASPARRSDDSLLEQHDGIQSAILHCKRSFNPREYASTFTLSEEKSTCSMRKSFKEDETNI